MTMLQDLIIVSSLTIIIHMIDTFSYSVRLAGVRTRRLALALSLFNILVLISRTSNMVQGPLAGGFVDYGAQTGDLGWVETRFRLIILSATIGSFLGALLIPTFIRIFSQAIVKLELYGSIPHLLRRTLTIGKIRRIGKEFSPPRVNIHRFRIAGVPKRLIILQIAITAIYTVGVLAAMFASLLVPEHATRAVMSSGIINGIATILYTVFVDPQVALLTDEVIHDKKSYLNISNMVGVLIMGKIVGTLIGQLIFIPSAKIIAYFTIFIS
ncbi:lipid II flippase Amj family protein [Tepidibacillus infernus]|uniref:lipid II flippase Amj family protein n=1 Tax=Tepidibacillus infernus TaxID=1806172 RepID=UPI003B6F4007